ncbi:MAG: glycosyltransferase family 4 protein [Bdellovibrionales bacterium]|nr:glycosyltransferase family 4 protein [Bdellovibrionales bacterium]
MEASSQLRPESQSLVAHHTLRVLLDARKIEDGGIGVYIQNLITGILGQSGVRLALLMRPGHSTAYPWLSDVELVYDQANSYSLDELLRLARRVDFSAFDLYHSPHYTLPLGIKIPSVVTIHDLIHVHHPERYYYPFVAKSLLRSALRHADKVLTVSQSTYKDLLRFCRNRPKILRKISVIPNAVDPFLLEQRIDRGRAKDFVEQRFKLRGPYFLSVLSNIKPHKGVADLLEAYRAFRAQIRDSKSSLPDYKLVLVGKGTESMFEIERLLDQVGSIQGIYVCGKVSKEELSFLYGAAGALVVSSIAEGFCLPVIEAQALGIPVIARPVPAVLEILTEADMAAGDFSVSSLSASLVEFAGNSGSKSSLDPDRLQQHLSRFEAAAIGRAVHQVYRGLLEEDRG